MKLYGLRCVIRGENNQKFDKSMTTDNDSVGVKPNQVTGISRAEHFGSPMFKPAQARTHAQCSIALARDCFAVV